MDVIIEERLMKEKSNVHLSAILVTGNRASATSSSVGPGKPEEQRDPQSVSLACVDVLGQSVLERTVAGLRRARVGHIFVVASARCPCLAHTRGAKVTVAETLADRWAAAQRILKKQAHRGTDTVFIAELGAYAEFDFEHALNFHWGQEQPITPLRDNTGELGYWLVETEWVRSTGDYSLPFANSEMSSGSVAYRVEGYVNRLANARDFRRLVVDAFLGRCAIAPRGHEIKPGVWVDEDVQVHKTARVVAPAYLGRNTAVHSGAVITRFSNLERRSQVGEGSVVANASVLPHTVIGRGLDVSAAMVDGNEWVDLRRNIALQIPDPNLISNTAVAQPAPPLPHAEHEEADRDLQPAEVEVEYPKYLGRAVNRALEVFKDEV